MAADLGDSAAMTNYANILSEGKDIEQNLSEAARYFKMAIDKEKNKEYCRIIVDFYISMLKNILSNNHPNDYYLLKEGINYFKEKNKEYYEQIIDYLKSYANTNIINISEKNLNCLNYTLYLLVENGYTNYERMSHRVDFLTRINGVNGGLEEQFNTREMVIKNVNEAESKYIINKSKKISNFVLNYTGK